MEFSKYFKVRVPNTGLMKGMKKYKDGEACDSTFQYGHVFFPNGVQRDFCRKGSKCGFDERHQKTR